MNNSNSFYQLFTANFKMMFRNSRGVFFNLIFPIGLYIAITKIVGFVPNSGGDLYAAFLLPGIIAMTVMQTGIFSVSYWLIDLRAKGALKRLVVTPLSPVEMVASVVASRLVLILLQVALLILIGQVMFHVPVTGNYLAILLLVLVGGSTFLSVGFLVSNIANNYEEAAPITTIVNLIFTFLGNIFFSTEAFPGILKFFSNILPVTHMAQGIRSNFLDTNWSFTDNLKDIGSLLIWLVVLVVVNAYLFRKKLE